MFVLNFRLSPKSFKVKNSTDEVLDQLEHVNRKNKLMHEEITELQLQVTKTSKDIHDIEKEKRAVDQERTDLQGLDDIFFRKFK